MGVLTCVSACLALFIGFRALALLGVLRRSQVVILALLAVRALL